MDNKEIQVLIEKSIKLTEEIKKKKEELDSIKAQLEMDALEKMDNKNKKSAIYYSKSSSAAVLLRTKLSTINPTMLKGLLGNVAIDNMTKIEEVTYEIKPALADAMSILLTEAYGELTLEEALASLGIDDKGIKLLQRKLKGDYEKDTATLRAYNPDKFKDTDSLEEEFDVIKSAINRDKVLQFFEIETLTPDFINKLNRCVAVDEVLQLKLIYDKEKKERKERKAK